MMIASMPPALVAPASPKTADAKLPEGIYADTKAILNAMADSAAGWDAGDLDRFMSVYADDADYVTATGLMRGKKAIADRYRPNFVSGGNTRGNLTFSDFRVRVIDPKHDLLTARWTLAGLKPQSGMTTLLFERRAEGWRIISDHSS